MWLVVVAVEELWVAEDLVAVRVVRTAMAGGWEERAALEVGPGGSCSAQFRS